MFKKMRRLFSVALVLSMLTATGLQVGEWSKTSRWIMASLHV